MIKTFAAVMVRPDTAVFECVYRKYTNKEQKR